MVCNKILRTNSIPCATCCNPQSLETPSSKNLGTSVVPCASLHANSNELEIKQSGVFDALAYGLLACVLTINPTIENVPCAT